LEGGTKAHFQIELQITPDTPKGGVVSTTANRGTFVGLENKEFGIVRLGTQETMAYETFALDANGRVEYKPQLWRLTQTAGDSKAQQDRAGNSVKYITPSISGFTLHGIVGFGESTSQNTIGTYTSYAVKYSDDKIKAAVVREEVGSAAGQACLPGQNCTDGVAKDGGTAATALLWGGSSATKTYRNVGAASYDFGPAVLNYIYAKAYTRTNDGNITTHTFGVKVPFEKTTLALSYGIGSIDSYYSSTSSTYTTKAGDASLTDITIGAFYNFDKSTSAYILASETSVTKQYVQAGNVRTGNIGLQYKF
jgi:predicted porin